MLTFNILDILQSGEILLSDSICRICLKKSSDMTSIFCPIVIETESSVSSTASQTVRVLDLFENFTQIKLYKHFSIMICKICIKSAVDAYIFKMKVRENETWLHLNIAHLKIIKCKDKEVNNDPKSPQSNNSKGNVYAAKKYKRAELSTVVRFQCTDFSTNLSEKSAEIEQKSLHNLVGDEKKAELICENDFHNDDAPENSLNIPEQNFPLPEQMNAEIEQPITENEEDEMTTLNSENLLISKHNSLLSKQVNKEIEGTAEYEYVSLVESDNMKEDKISTDYLENTKNPEEYSVETNENTNKILPEYLRDHDYGLIYCDICDEYFSDKYVFKQHTMIHTGRTYMCKFCDKVFKKNVLYRQHMKIHSKKTSIVKKHQHNTIESILKEVQYPFMMNSEGKKMVQCEICGDMSQNFAGIIKHTRIKHVKNYNYACHICGEGFNYRSEFFNHFKCHLIGKPFHCADCDQKFDKISDISSHVTIHRKDSLPTPNKKIKEFQEIRKSSELFLCSYCGKPFKNKYGLDAHTRTHTGEKAALCPVCGKTFISTNKFNFHMKFHYGFRYQCEICGKSYKQKTQLKIHVKYHTGFIPFTCEICGKSFKEKFYLRNHMKFHNDERNYECLVCEKKFLSKCNLNEHMKLHAKEKSLSCKYCDKIFLKDVVRRHHELGHEGKKSFDCKFCKKNFRSYRYLEGHISKNHNAE